ncbi:uncharacterized protein IWZ02DRAFT_273945 [Phyllosticta citriasiana]|uniref:Maintenance of mitochondrial morphology protein 1 n=1 Tax=Phyllosticta citriasiana TaxID=595635 RepID=A0ABR1KZN5_9PEZI
MAAATASTPAPQSSSLSFTQGFLLGQISITLIIFCFIKFFIFGEPPPPEVRHATRGAERRQRTLSHQRSLGPNSSLLRHKHSTILRPPPPVTSDTILAKTYYNVKGHQPESLDWFNVLVAQTIAQLRADARQDGAVLTSLTNILNGPTRPDWLGEIRVTEIELGDEFPIFSNCRIIPVEDRGFGLGSPSKSEGSSSSEGRLQARMDVDLSDVITLGIETTLKLNWPKPQVATLPVALAVSVIRFSGTLAVSFIPSAQPPTSNDEDYSEPNNPRNSTSSHTHTPTTLAFTFLDDYRLDLSVRSLLGSRSRLQDVPKIAQLIESRLHTWFDERCVEPRFQQILLPSLWPRKRNTRGGEDEAADADLDGRGDVGEDGRHENYAGTGPASNMDASPPRPKSGAAERGSLKNLRGNGSGGGGNGTATPPTAAAPTSAPASSKQAAATSSRSSYVPADELEARMAAEGQKMREAEQRAKKLERTRSMRTESEMTRPGNLRLRSTGTFPHSSREASARAREWRAGPASPASAAARPMPGSMPGAPTTPTL